MHGVSIFTHSARDTSLHTPSGLQPHTNKAQVCVKTKLRRRNFMWSQWHCNNGEERVIEVDGGQQPSGTRRDFWGGRATYG
jgi:hypothetical protein